MAASSEKAREEVGTYVKSCKSGFQLLSTAADFQGTMPKGILTGPFPNWKAISERMTPVGYMPVVHSKRPTERPCAWGLGSFWERTKARSSV